MKTKHILGALIFGMVLIITGALFKILHLPGAAILLMIGMALEIVAALLFIVKLIKTKDFSNFLNK